MNTESIVFTPNYETNGFKVDFPEGSLKDPNFTNFISDQYKEFLGNKSSFIKDLVKIGTGSIVSLIIFAISSNGKIKIEDIETMEPNIRYNFIKGLTKDQLFKLCPDKESGKRFGKTLKECLEVLQITEEQKQTDLKEFYEFMKEFNETQKEEKDQ